MAPDAHPTDPWSSIEPIGQRDDRADAPTHPAADQSDQVDAPPPPFHGLTQHEYQRRTARTKNARDAAVPVPETATATPRRSVKLRPSLTVREILGMNERMMKRFYKRATDDSARAADQKFAAVGFGVAVDKFTVLSTRSQERPSTVSEREGLRALAVRLLTERQSEDAADVEDGCRESAG